MPFIVQCPHADCRKFMLLEDSVRGEAVDCLLCKKPIKIEVGSTAGSPASHGAGQILPPGSRWSQPPEARTRIQQCPRCKASLRIAADQTGPLKCPSCDQAFAV